MNLPVALEVRTGTLESLRPVRLPLTVSEPGCYRVAVTAENRADDISLVVYQSGEERARDRLSGKSPTVDWCTVEAGDVEAAVSAYGGGGAFALALFRKKNAPKRSQAAKAGGRDKDLIANRIRQLGPRYAEGKKPITPLLRGALTRGKVEEFTVRLNGRCIAVLAAHAPSLISINLTLLSSEGAATSSRVSTAGFTVLETAPPCPTPGLYTVRVRAAEGGGDFGMQLFAE